MHPESADWIQFGVKGQTIVSSVSERNALRLGQWTMLILAILGLVAYFLSSAAALSVDAAYSLLNFASAIVARKVLVSARSRPDHDHPYGNGSVENFYVMARSLIIVGMIGLAFIGAVVSLLYYFLYGESEDIHLGIAGGYGILAGVIFFGLSMNYAKAERVTNSGVLHAERNATKLDAIMSAATGVTFIAVAMIPSGTFLTSADFDIRQIADSLLVIVLVVLLIPEPWHTIRVEFGRITGTRMDAELEGQIRQMLVTIPALEVTDVYAVKRGSLVEADVRVSFHHEVDIERLDQWRKEILAILNGKLGRTRVHVVFTNLSIDASNE